MRFDCNKSLGVSLIDSLLRRLLFLAGPLEEPLHTAVTCSGGAQAKDRAIISRTSLQMSSPGARASASPWWLSKWWSTSDGPLKQLVLLPVFWVLEFL